MGDLFNLSGEGTKSGGKKGKTGGKYSTLLRQAGENGKGLTPFEVLHLTRESFNLDQEVRSDIRAGQKEAFVRGDLVFSMKASKTVDKAGKPIDAKRGSLRYYIISRINAASMSANDIAFVAGAVDWAFNGRASGARLGYLNEKGGGLSDSFKEVQAEQVQVKVDKQVDEQVDQ